MAILINIPLFFISAEAYRERIIGDWEKWSECEGKGGGRTYYSYRRTVQKNEVGYWTFARYEWYISRRNHNIKNGSLGKEKIKTGTLQTHEYAPNWRRKCA